MKTRNIIVSVLFLFIFSFGETTIFASNYENPGETPRDLIDQNKGATENILDIEREIQKHYGSFEEFEKMGGLYFDSDGVLHMNFKDSQNQMNVKAVQAIKGKIKDKKLVSHKTVGYSKADLNVLKNKILRDIKGSFSPEDFNELNFSISASFPSQKIILKHQDIPEETIIKLKENYGELFEEKDSNEEYGPTKGREESWNQLGAGLGLKFSDGGGCTTAGIASKSGNYFILTAAHCFNGTTSSTGGSLVRQWDHYVGRQHADASGRSLDAGLVRITSDNNLLYGRSATNKIKRWASTSVFDGSFVGWTTLYNGMYICKTGKTTDTTCGYVVNDDTTVKYDGYPTFNVAEIDGDYANWSLPGDSGGAVFYQTGGKLYLSGIVSGNKTRNGVVTGGFVTQYRDVQAAYGITLYTSESNYKVAN
jgi:hypothetical protein